MSHTNFRRRGWDPAVRKAGLDDGPRVTVHDARHAYASLLAANGLAPSEVAEYLGHTRGSTAETIYIHAWGKREARDQKVRDALMRAKGLTVAQGGQS